MGTDRGEREGRHGLGDVGAFFVLIFGFSSETSANPTESKVPLRRASARKTARGARGKHRGGAGAAMLKLGEHVPHDWLGHRARARTAHVPYVSRSAITPQ